MTCLVFLRNPTPFFSGYVSTKWLWMFLRSFCICIFLYFILVLNYPACYLFNLAPLYGSLFLISRLPQADHLSSRSLPRPWICHFVSRNRNAQVERLVESLGRVSMCMCLWGANTGSGYAVHCCSIRQERHSISKRQLWIYRHWTWMSFYIWWNL